MWQKTFWSGRWGTKGQWQVQNDLVTAECGEEGPEELRLERYSRQVKRTQLSLVGSAY